jgi:cobalt-zinc-cadmium efflux system outer membrane protein
MSKNQWLRVIPFPAVRLGLFPLLVSSCVSYEARPIDLKALLSQLNQAQVVDVLGGNRALKGNGLDVRTATLFALRNNPGIKAFREQLKVAKLGVDAAGLFPNLEIGWDAMDVVAVETTGGKAKAEQFISGLGLSFRIPRPGELGAEKEIARAKKEEATQVFLQAQWSLALKTCFAWLRVKRMEAALTYQKKAFENAKRLALFFVEAKSIGAATSMEENLALVEKAKIEAELIRQKGNEEKARRALNLLLGISPEKRIPLGGVPKGLWLEEKGDLAILCEKALELRPDLCRLMARYQQAEENLRLEISRQWPGLWLGTGINLSLPIFSGFNGPQIDVAKAVREKRRGDLVLAVHRVRAEIAEALANKRQANQIWGVLKKGLLPAANRNLVVLQRAFDSGRVTLLETLIGQRQIIDARLQELDARMERLKSSLQLGFACGNLPLDLKPGSKTLRGITGNGCGGK